MSTFPDDASVKLHMLQCKQGRQSKILALEKYVFTRSHFAYLKLVTSSWGQMQRKAQAQNESPSHTFTRDLWCQMEPVNISTSRI